MTLSPLILTAAGGSLGAMSRAILHRHLDTHFPWATFVVNALGSFLLGIIMAALANRAMLEGATIAVGFCGGFTTFSTFSFSTLKLFRTGHPGKAIVNIGLNLIACPVALWLGIVLG